MYSYMGSDVGSRDEEARRELGCRLGFVAACLGLLGPGVGQAGLGNIGD